MKRNGRAHLLVVAAALIFSACGGAAEKAGGDTKSASAPPTVNSASPTPTADVVAVPASTTNELPASAGVATSRQGTSSASGSHPAGSAPPAKLPTPRIGSGGHDLFLFTQARAAINNDGDLKAANVVIDVKEGVVT